jgi:glycogen debranching enzyme
MSPEGFNVRVATRWEDGTGFVQGGSVFNCGTWMDKMGDSEKAGNRGVPATPRDGSAVEIVGLQRATLRWISELLIKNKQYWPWNGITCADGTKVSYADWGNMLKKSFEKYFFVPEAGSEGQYIIPRPDLVARRNMYKDTLDPSQDWSAYQLRPNFCIAMVVAPELFTPELAWKALDVAKKVLVGPLGIKTLDPNDWAYRGNYDNGNDSTDYNVAHGFNYHQGPEWGWVLGYFLRAYLKFGLMVTKDRAEVLFYLS